MVPTVGRIASGRAGMAAAGCVALLAIGCSSSGSGATSVKKFCALAGPRLSALGRVTAPTKPSSAPQSEQVRSVLAREDAAARIAPPAIRSDMRTEAHAIADTHATPGSADAQRRIRAALDHVERWTEAHCGRAWFTSMTCGSSSSQPLDPATGKPIGPWVTYPPQPCVSKPMRYGSGTSTTPSR